MKCFTLYNDHEDIFELYISDHFCENEFGMK